MAAVGRDGHTIHLVGDGGFGGGVFDDGVCREECHMTICICMILMHDASEAVNAMRVIDASEDQR